MKPTTPSERASVQKNREPAKHAASSGTGGTKVSVDELVGMGRTVVDRVRPYVQRAVDRVKSRR